MTVPVTEIPSKWNAILGDRTDVYDTNLVAFAGLTALVWDHIITFDDEVEYIWKRKKGLLACLFLLNRYLTPLGFVINIVAFTLPSWSVETSDFSCQHFVRYEGSMTVIGIQTAGLIMFLRVRALYSRQRLILGVILLLWFTWLGINAYLLTTGVAVQHSIDERSCSMIFDTPVKDAASASAWFPLLYDTCIFLLTVYKTKRRSGHIIRAFLSDGILYYSVICAVNVVLTIMIVDAGQGVRNITAQLELLLTVAMASRITLNLRKQASGDFRVYVASETRSQALRELRRPRGMWVGPASLARPAKALQSRVHSLTSGIVPRPRPADPPPGDDRPPYLEHMRLDEVHLTSPTPKSMSSFRASPVSEEV